MASRGAFASTALCSSSARARGADIYLDMLPLINAGRVELLEHRRLAAQLVGLERRTARSGRDSVNHGPDGHDDLANAVAGVLVNLDLDRRPLLAPQSALLVNDAGFTPAHANCVFAVVVIGDDGTAATLFCAPAPHRGAPLRCLRLPRRAFHRFAVH